MPGASSPDHANAAEQREAAALRINRWTSNREGEAWFAAQTRRACALHLQFREALKEWREGCRQRVEQLIADGHLKAPLPDDDYDDRTRYEIVGIASEEAVALARRAPRESLSAQCQTTLREALLQILRRPKNEVTVWDHGFYPASGVHPPAENTLQFYVWIKLPDQPIDPLLTSGPEFAKLQRADRVAIAATWLASLHAQEMPDQYRLPTSGDPAFDICAYACSDGLSGLPLEGLLNLVEAALNEGDSELPNDLISQERASEIAEVNSNTIRTWMNGGKLPYYGSRRQISERELRKLLPTLRERLPRTKSSRRSR